MQHALARVRERSTSSAVQVSFSDRGGITRVMELHLPGKEAVRWVDGPNRQFEKMMRWVAETVPRAMVFVKEIDTVPQKDNHYVNLLGEIDDKEPFFVLGR